MLEQAVTGLADSSKWNPQSVMVEGKKQPDLHCKTQKVMNWQHQIPPEVRLK